MLESGNAKLNVNSQASVFIDEGRLELTSSTGLSSMIVEGTYNEYGRAQGFRVKCGSYVLEAKSDGLYYNGTKIGG